MKLPETSAPDTLRRNEDPLTHEHGAHPLSTGVGAAGGGAAGAAVGLAAGGPIGAVIGAIAGAVAGGLGGSAVGEAIDPTQENEAWPGEKESQRVEDRPGEDPELDGQVKAREPSGLAEGAGHDDRPLFGSPTDAEIAFRAWSYYEAEGKEHGHALDHWLRAEAELRREAEAKYEFTNVI